MVIAAQFDPCHLDQLYAVKLLHSLCDTSSLNWSLDTGRTLYLFLDLNIFGLPPINTNDKIAVIPDKIATTKFMFP